MACASLASANIATKLVAKGKAYMDGFIAKHSNVSIVTSPFEAPDLPKGKFDFVPKTLQALGADVTLSTALYRILCDEAQQHLLGGAAGVDEVTMRSTWSRTSSAANAGS